jgi:hypothetical protein
LRLEKILMPFEKTIQRTTEPLYEDEQLRSNLADDEARVVLDWAARWIEEQVGLAKDETSARQVAQRALARVRPVINAINALAAQPGEFRLSNAVAAIEPALKFEQKVPSVRVADHSGERAVASSIPTCQKRSIARPDCVKPSRTNELFD